MSGNGRLHGRRIIITGAASGIGAATSRLFAAEGAKLALFDRDGGALRELATALGAQAFPMDVTDEAGVRQAVEAAGAALEGLDGLVNCAGIMCSDTLAGTTLATWERVMAVNLTGPFLMCRAAAPLLAQQEGATIVTVASAQALIPGIAGSAYAASKAGTMSFTKSLAIELAPRIRANVVCPGAATTPMGNAALAHLDDAGRAQFARRYALGRLSKPEEVAAAILFLTSEESSSITGVALAVDGGRTFH